jgi:hypothetical protein
VADPVVIEKDMSLSAAEFFRDLPRAVPAGYRVDGRRVTVVDGPRRAEIAVVEEGERRIAALALPRIKVRIKLEGFDVAAAAAFMTRFEQAYQRGGG